MTYSDTRHNDPFKIINEITFDEKSIASMKFDFDAPHRTLDRSYVYLMRLSKVQGGTEGARQASRKLSVRRNDSISSLNVSLLTFSLVDLILSVLQSITPFLAHNPPLSLSPTSSTFSVFFFDDGDLVTKEPTLVLR